jgi:hypothetical protein
MKVEISVELYKDIALQSPFHASSHGIAADDFLLIRTSAFAEKFSDWLRSGVST